MKFTKDMAENRLKEMNMGDMPITEIKPTPTNVASDWFKSYKHLCREFMRSLTDSVEELAFMNLNQNEFMSLIMGKNVPQNISIRFRIPLIWGGKLEIDNLFMCSTFPYSQKLDQFILEQSGSDSIWLPNPVKKIYIQAHTSSGGDGGNATEDRLSQIAAQIVAAKGMEQ